MNNDNRKDRFFPMDKSEFNKCICFALRNGDRQICFAKIKDDKFYGGMAKDFNDALHWCKKFYEEDKDIRLTIGDYSEAVCIWDHTSILHELGFISKEEYDKYLDSIDLED